MAARLRSREEEIERGMDSNASLLMSTWKILVDFKVYKGRLWGNLKIHDADKHDFELDFKKFWEQFRSSSSEKEKEMALNMAVDVFCRLVKQQSSVAQYQN
ncbi:hypothetical protein J5N97_017534 [Dioscorea zingiberensis]|uniref:Uncharacterized protein n=1 Tax=Dioscorea zingiberensis TaxID=325984 RepID=A0A9D5CM72_9LILI|nr:hypothetical protein J5N97_017534 [Dioscorea zingiberensis]